ncbi:GNAT family N-acetyltransferase [Streptomyces sp. NPDC021224]|uniref:GNAT family N-acetyltransferase n=1 Tax=unclassified Streptomyces TaxID=2593676 RepID=UPI0037A7F610
MPPADSDTEDTLDLRLPPDFLALPGVPGKGGPATSAGVAAHAAGPPTARGCALVGRVAEWAGADTPAGAFRLVPAHADRDLALVSGWMNDPAVAEFWELAGEAALTRRHIAAQTFGDGRSVPCLGLLDGRAMSYWEVYRADLDPLARHYPARPQDTGVHLLIGGGADRGRGLGGTLIKAVADLILQHRPGCTRVVAEPDIRNTASVAAFLGAGFRLSAELSLPGKRAALMVRDRALRRVL